MDKEAWHAAVHGAANRHNWATELNWVTRDAEEAWPVNVKFIPFLDSSSVFS